MQRAAKDKLSLQRFKADRAFMVGKGRGPLAAYLSIEDVVPAAKLAATDAIHPGYGFRSLERGATVLAFTSPARSRQTDVGALAHPRQRAKLRPRARRALRRRPVAS
jgi:biotin carboxylase